MTSYIIFDSDPQKKIGSLLIYFYVPQTSLNKNLYTTKEK